MNKPMSAADYAAHAEKVKASRPTEIVTLKSGSVFELRRPDLKGYVLTGRLPQSLVAEGLQALKKGQPPTAEDIEKEDLSDFPIFAAQIIRECCVSPRVDEIEMLVEDAWEIFSWAMGHQGVAGIDGLRSFREGQERGAPDDKPVRKKRRRKTVATAAN